MRFIQELGFSVKVGKEEAHQKWLIENDNRIAQAQPKGTRYIGTFGTVFSSEKGAGGYRSLFELDSYGAMDAAAALNKDPKSELGKVYREWSVFWDYDLAAPWSSTLMKDVNDVSLFDPKT